MLHRTIKGDGRKEGNGLMTISKDAIFLKRSNRSFFFCNEIERSRNET